MNNDLISRSALLDSFDVRKVTEYDETGCGMEGGLICRRMTQRKECGCNFCPNFGARMDWEEINDQK